MPPRPTFDSRGTDGCPAVSRRFSDHVPRPPSGANGCCFPGKSRSRARAGGAVADASASSGSSPGRCWPASWPESSPGRLACPQPPSPRPTSMFPQACCNSTRLAKTFRWSTSPTTPRWPISWAPRPDHSCFPREPVGRSSRRHPRKRFCLREVGRSSPRFPPASPARPP